MKNGVWPVAPNEFWWDAASTKPSFEPHHSSISRNSWWWIAGHKMQSECREIDLFWVQSGTWTWLNANAILCIQECQAMPVLQNKAFLQLFGATGSALCSKSCLKFGHTIFQIALLCGIAVGPSLTSLISGLWYSTGAWVVVLPLLQILVTCVAACWSVRLLTVGKIIACKYHGDIDQGSLRFQPTPFLEGEYYWKYFRLSKLSTPSYSDFCVHTGLYRLHCSITYL